MFDVKQVFTDVPAAENADWGYGRNCRILLRTQNSEFGQSVFSVNVAGGILPNRDYPYEGLSAIIGNENWKFLDGLIFKLKRGEEAIQLAQKHVRIYPWKATYFYALHNSNAELQVEYYLMRNSNVPILEVSFALKGHKSDGLKLSIEPLVDIRHMYSASFPEEHKPEVLTTGLCVSRDDKHMFLLTKNPFAPNLSPRTQDWRYKLGNGSREFNGHSIVFPSDSRRLYFPGAIELSFVRNSASLQISCINGKKTNPNFELRNHDEKTFIAKMTRLQKPLIHSLKKAESFGKHNRLALQGRIFNLMESFDLSDSKLQAPDAGAFWFRNIWFRDAFQGIYDNFDPFYKNKKAYLKSFLLKSLLLQQNGQIPNKLSEHQTEPVDYSSADSILLCFICTLEYLRRSHDKTLQQQFHKSVKSYLQSLSNGPVRMENYLLKTSANHSWIDSKYHVRFFNADSLVPSRIPYNWVQKIADSSKDFEEFSVKIYSPIYYLVEINALWIRFLKDFVFLYPSKEFEALESSASINFKSFFFNEGAFELLDESFQKSDVLCSASLYSAALLPEMFSGEEIASLVRKFETSFVYRNKKLFGVLTRNFSNHVYLDDADYHGAVIWPRESVPLFKLLSRTNDPRAKELLESNLEHQMEEGAIFFNQELFALPEGANPAPCSTSYSPVPVKNPAQFWSQWVQPYFDYLK